MNVLRSVFSVLAFVALVTFNSYSQDELSDFIKSERSARVFSAAVSSTGTGGLWSAPSTWAGGVVPGASDDVTIIGGSVVVIDTDVTVGNITVGDGTLNPGVLTFDPATARAFTVNGDLTISGGLSTLTTPSTGSVTTHTVTIGGNLTNNGILDLSTNGNLAGAGLVFKNASNNTFGGGGSMTDVRTITIDKGTAIANTLELTVSNFSVQGSTVDGPASGYLSLTNGTFKISGLFSGNHRTFPSASYAIPQTAGIWLNNPNYKVTGQDGDLTLSGTLKVSAGTYSVGTVATNILRVAETALFTGGKIVVEGGNLNVSGAIRRAGLTNSQYTQSGGTTTTCIAGNFAPCFDLAAGGLGGKLVIQTPALAPSDTVQDFMGTFGLQPTSTPVVFGNADTEGPGVFTFSTDALGGPASFALEIDTTAGGHTVKAASGVNAVRLVNPKIGAGGTLDVGGYPVRLSGSTFINNGTFKLGPNTSVEIDQPGADFTFSGSGVVSGAISLFSVRGNLIFDPGITNIHVRTISVENSSVTNASRLTLGIGDDIPSTIYIRPGTVYDTPLTFDLGTGGQKVVYGILGTTTWDTGNEINPTRQLTGLSAFGGTCCTTTLNITGGDLTVNGPIEYNGIIDLGNNTLRHLSGTITPGGFRTYVRGKMVRRFTETGQVYTFPVGETRHTPARVTASSLLFGSVDVAVTGREGYLSGMPQAVPCHWEMEQTGSMTSKLELFYVGVLSTGNESRFRAWRDFNGTFSMAPGTGSTVNDIVTGFGISNLTGTWGISERPPTGAMINLSGSVTASNGGGIRNSTVVLSGGDLQMPRVIQTGNFGTYSFTGVEAGLVYTISVSAKRYRFSTSSQTLTPSGDITNLDFTANPQEEFKLGIK